MSNTDVTNPDLVDVADQDVERNLMVDQTILVTRSPAADNNVTPVGDGLGGNTVTVTNPDLVDVADESEVKGVPRNVFP